EYIKKVSPEFIEQADINDLEFLSGENLPDHLQDAVDERLGVLDGETPSGDGTTGLGLGDVNIPGLNTESNLSTETQTKVKEEKQKETTKIQGAYDTIKRKYDAYKQKEKELKKDPKKWAEKQKELKKIEGERVAVTDELLKFKNKAEEIAGLSGDRIAYGKSLKANIYKWLGDLNGKIDVTVLKEAYDYVNKQINIIETKLGITL